MTGFETVTLVISFLALIVSCGGLLYTYKQVTLLRRQLQVDVKSRIGAVNRELLTLALQDTDLLLLFEDKPFVNKAKGTRYLQMWVNHIRLMWDAHEQKLVSDGEWYSDLKDIADFFSIASVWEYWCEVRSFYPPDFVSFISKLKPMPAEFSGSL